MLKKWHFTIFKRLNRPVKAIKASVSAVWQIYVFMHAACTNREDLFKLLLDLFYLRFQFPDLFFKRKFLFGVVGGDTSLPEGVEFSLQ